MLYPVSLKIQNSMTCPCHIFSYAGDNRQLIVHLTCDPRQAQADHLGPLVECGADQDTRSNMFPYNQRINPFDQSWLRTCWDVAIDRN